MVFSSIPHAQILHPSKGKRKIGKFDKNMQLRTWPTKEHNTLADECVHIMFVGLYECMVYH